MGNTRNFVLIFFLVAAGAPLHKLFAQEHSLTTPESTEGRHDQYAQRDGVVETVAPAVSESEGEAQAESATGSDSTQASTKPADRERTDASKNEDLVSFNFLYYIIQRYKMSDIVDRKAAQ